MRAAYHNILPSPDWNYASHGRLFCLGPVAYFRIGLALWSMYGRLSWCRHCIIDRMYTVNDLQEIRTVATILQEERTCEIHEIFIALWM